MMGRRWSRLLGLPLLGRLGSVRAANGRDVAWS